MTSSITEQLPISQSFSQLKPITPTNNVATSSGNVSSTIQKSNYSSLADFNAIGIKEKTKLALKYKGKGHLRAKNSLETMSDQRKSKL